MFLFVLLFDSNTSLSITSLRTFFFLKIFYSILIFSYFFSCFRMTTRLKELGGTVLSGRNTLM